MKKYKFKSNAERDAFLDWLERHAKNLTAAARMTNYSLVRIRSLKLPTKNAMEVDVDHKYLNFTLDYNPAWAAEYWQKKEYEELLSVLAHEIAHVATSEADDKLIYISSSKERSFYFERLTELTSRWLYRYYFDSYMEAYNIKLAPKK